MMGSVIKEYKELKSNLIHFSKQYYDLNDPVISDEEFDSLKKRLESIEKQHPELIDSDSPTQLVGSDFTTKLEAVKHETPMLSLDNALNRDEAFSKIIAICNLLKIQPSFVDMVAELKYDGLSCKLIYVNGVLSQAITRGNGVEGENVTHTVSKIKNVPKKIKNIKQDSEYSVLEIIGEIILPKSSMSILNAEREKDKQKPYKNTRNAIAGVIRQLDTKYAEMSGAMFMPYAMNTRGSDLDIAVTSHHINIRLFSLLGFEDVEKHSRLLRGIDDCLSYFKTQEEIRNDLPFEIDGIVYKIDNLYHRQLMGNTLTAPRWAFAYKFEPQKVITKLLSIDHQVGRTGTINPVAKLEPVFVGGVTVSNCTLHNEGEILRKDLRIGDWVVVQRAGDVVPEVVEPVTHMRNGSEVIYTPPTGCPSCGSAVIKDGADHYCTGNLKCPDQKLTRLSYFVSKQCMDIDGLGEATISDLIDLNAIAEPNDIYKVDYNVLGRLAGYGHKTIQNIIDQVNKSRDVSFSRFICSLAIDGINKGYSEKLADRFKNVDELINTTTDELSLVDSFGPARVTSVINYIKNNLDKIIELSNLVNIQYDKVETVSNIFSGKSFVITGTLSKPRLSYESIIKSNGGEVSGSVSKNTSYLIAGLNPKSKYQKAEKLGVPILSEAEFNQLLS